MFLHHDYAEHLQLLVDELSHLVYGHSLDVGPSGAAVEFVKPHTLHVTLLRYQLLRHGVCRIQRKGLHGAEVSSAKQFKVAV